MAAIDVAVGRRIQRRRRERGITQSELARRAGMPEDQLRRIEAGQERPGGLLMDIARELDVSVAYFYQDDD